LSFQVLLIGISKGNEVFLGSLLLRCDHLLVDLGSGLVSLLKAFKHAPDFFLKIGQENFLFFMLANFFLLR
jgi:hypothetical protein